MGLSERRSGFGVGLAVGAVLAAAAGALVMRTTAPSTAPPDPAGATASSGARPHLGSSSSGPGTPSGSTPSADAGATVGRPSPVRGDSRGGAPLPPGGAEGPDDDEAPPSPEALLDALEDPVRPPRQPAARGQWLEDNVVMLLTSVAPELDGADVTRDCTPDGSACTIEGPWPGDDFLQRWIDAISDGVVAPGDLSGMTFDRFENTDGEDGPGFRIVARVPDR